MKPPALRDWKHWRVAGTASVAVAIIVVLACAAAQARLRAQQAPRISVDPSELKCPVTPDASYGVDIENPVKVGGGPMYGAARERRYLDALRGPGGQVVRFTRNGSGRAADGTIVDIYDVTYDGLQTPLRVYLDWYHYQEQSAPPGLVCGQPIGLGPPPVDPFRAMEETTRLAIDLGPKREFNPLPLDSDGGTAHGVLFDSFRMLARAARDASGAGAPLDVRTLPAEVLRPRTVIVAYPIACGGRTIAPVALDIVGLQDASAPRKGDLAKGASIAALVPGFLPPEGSIAAAFELPNVRPGDRVKISYAEPVCPAGVSDISLSPRLTTARPLQMPVPPRPDGVPASSGPVHFQVLIDDEGRLQRPFLLGGPPALVQAAAAALANWRAEPARLNGAPIVSAVVLQVRFK
jgi:hypothetical protein